MPLARTLSGILVVVLSLSTGCGDDSGGDDGGSDAGEQPGHHGGDSGSGGDRGGGRDDAGSADAGTGGAGRDAGGGDRDGSVPVGSGFGAIWKQASSELLVIDPANPSSFEQNTVEIPDAVHDEVSGQDIEFYQQFVGDELLTFAHRDRDTVYYVLRQAAQKIDDETYFVPAADGSHIYTLEGGLLVDTGSTLLGDLSVTFTLKYEPLAGPFPPSHWPSKSLEGAP
jgi:hypothetical protein